MPRRLHNWSYRDLTDFLREKGFRFSKEIRGSHQQWTKSGLKNEPDTLIEVCFRKNAYPVGTMKGSIAKSGIPEDEWLAWSGS
jgi:hypothetical protein